MASYLVDNIRFLAHSGRGGEERSARQLTQNPTISVFVAAAQAPQAGLQRMKHRIAPFSSQLVSVDPPFPLA
ncbi:hypothetical protein [Sinorhizobium meliloti]|uniref:hypothetical protein n=1 Tax=Rhizobium meliloti TaxID=382 RepID=UPI0013E3A008|nr:hypothetical protein [Sinorhizobium meliloti]